MFILVSFCFAVSVNAKTWNAQIEVPSDFTGNNFEIQVNGVTVDKNLVSGETHKYTVTVNDHTGFVTAIKYKDNGATGFERAPEKMAVWEVNYFYNAQTGEELTGVIRVPELDNALGYKGFAIKAPATANDSGGIRCSLTFDNEIKTNGVPNQGGGYTIEEYGMLHVFSRNWNASSPEHMTYGGETVETIPCYVKGGINYVHDTITKDGREKTVFAISLNDIVDYNVYKNFRGYVRIRKPSMGGGDVYLYGPIVGKNPYYIAQKYKENYDNGDKSLIGNNQALLDYVNVILGSSSTTVPADDICDIFFIGDSIMMGETLKSGVAFTESTFDYNPSKYYQLSTTPSQVLGQKLTDRFSAAASNHYDTTQSANKWGRNYQKVNCTLIANGGVSYSQPGINSPYNMPYLAEYACHETSAPEYIFLLAGINDWAFADQGEGENGNISIFGDPNTQNVGTGYSATDNSYVIGVDRTIKKLIDTYGTATNIIVCSPHRALKYESGGGSVYRQRITNRTLEEYSEAQKTIVDKYRNATPTKYENVYFIDLYHKLPGSDYLNLSGDRPEETSAYLSYYPDRIHPNPTGYSKMCQCILNEMYDLSRYGLNYHIIPDAPSRQTDQQQTSP